MDITLNQFMTFVVRHWELWLAFVVILICLISIELLDHIRGLKGISPQQVINLINRHDALIIDIRDPSAFQHGHILGAQSYHEKELIQKLDKLAKYKQQHVVIVCAAGQTAGGIAAKMKAQDFAHVAYLKGGMSAWHKASLPVQKEK